MKDVKNNWYKDFFNKYYLPLYLKKDIFSPIKVEREVNFLIKILNLSNSSLFVSASISNQYFVSWDSFLQMYILFLKSFFEEALLASQ